MNIQRQNQSKSPSVEDLSKHFSLPLSDAANNLGVCVSVLKKIFRENGLDRWPYRKYLAGKSIEDIKGMLLEKEPKPLLTFQRLLLTKVVSSSKTMRIPNHKAWHSLTNYSNKELRIF